jgi:hypothetical protein
MSAVDAFIAPFHGYLNKFFLAADAAFFRASAQILENRH